MEENLKGFIIFLTIVISIYLLTNLYIFFKGSNLLELRGWGFAAYILIFTLIALAFPSSFFLRHTQYCDLCSFITWAGSMWLGAMLYFFLLGVIFDIATFANFIFHFVPDAVRENRVFIGRVVFSASALFVALVVLFGYFHSKNVKIKNLELGFPNLAEVSNPTSVVFVSDLHLGLLVGEERLTGMVDEINAQNPDIILIGGDLLDESADNLAHTIEILSGLRARYGKYAVLGNHEFYVGVNESVSFMEKANISVLRDDLATIPGVANIIGLDDPTGKRRYRGIKEKPLQEIFKGRDKDLPTIVMIHTPVRIAEISGLGADLMLSGHTHNGQFFPVSFITDAIYHVGYGYEKVGNMHVYVSSGAATWGPPMRVLTDSEILKITLVRDGKNK